MKGYSFKIENIFQMFKKHYCPVCKRRYEIYTY